MAFTISFTLKIITEQLNLLAVSTIVCINLYLLYKYLVKLNTTKKAIYN
jgi:hypothetical protein